MTVKIAFGTILFAVAAIAAPVTTCPPNTNHDGILVSDTCPGLGDDILAIPNTVWRFWAEDLARNQYNQTTEPDFNDAFGTVTFNAVNVPTLTYVNVRPWLALYYDAISIFNPGPYNVGDVVTLQNHVVYPPSGIDRVFYSGPSADPHFIVLGPPLCPPPGGGAIPEPATTVLIALGLILVGGIKARSATNLP